MNIDNINIFEYAAKHKIRFNFRGSISVEDLYNLTEKELDTLYKSLKKQAEALFEEGLLETSKSIPLEARVKLALIKHVFNSIKHEKEAAAAAAEKAAKVRRLKELIAERSDKELQDKSMEELIKTLEALENE